MTRAREAARLIGNNTFRLDSNNAVGFNSTTPDAMFDINHGLTVAGISTFTGNVTMTGDLTVQGTTTTLETVIQEVGFMNIQANSSTPAIGVTQSGAGSIAAFYDGATEVVTIKNGGNIQLPDSTSSIVGRIEIGDGQYLQLFHNRTDSYIDNNGAGNLYIRSNSFLVQKYTGEEFARFNTDGAVELYYDNVKKFETTGGGINITGIVTATSFSGSDINVTGIVTSNSFSGSDINVTGVVTATSFSGNVIGNSTGLSGTPSIVIDDIDISGAYTQTIQAVSALDIDCSTGNYFTKTITTGTNTFTFSNAPSTRAYSFTLELTHTGGTASWPASVKWPGDTPPTLNTGTTHLLIFVTDDGGTRWRAASLANYVN